MTHWSPSPSSAPVSRRRWGALEGIGIRASVPEELFGPFSNVGGSGRTAVQVFESDRDRALIELRRMQMQIVEPRHAVADPPD